MYHSTNDDLNGKIYSKRFKLNSEERPILSSIAERCPKEEVDWGNVQERWNSKVAESISAIAEVNPYLNLSPGVEILGVDAASWDSSLRGLDCRPKLFDGVSKTWKLCDTGSMITVIKKGQEDKIDKTKNYKQSMVHLLHVMVKKKLKSELAGNLTESKQ